MHRKHFPRLIIISGSGKKVGKTFIATALIRAFSPAHPLIALKISPHVHDSLGNTSKRFSSEGFTIFEDLEPHEKNSGQFLEAGALQSFFIETDDEHLAGAFNVFMEKCNPLNHPVICESGALSRLVMPAIAIFISRPTDLLQESKLNTMNLADLVLPARNFSTSEIIERIKFFENRWQLTF